MSTLYNLLKKQKTIGLLPESKKAFQQLEKVDVANVIKSLPENTRKKILKDAQKSLISQGKKTFDEKELINAASEVIYGPNSGAASTKKGGGKRGNLKNTTDAEPEVMEGGNLESTADADLGDTPKEGISDSDKKLLEAAGFMPAEITAMKSNPIYKAKAVNTARERAGLTPTGKPKKTRSDQVPGGELVGDAGGINRNDIGRDATETGAYGGRDYSQISDDDLIGLYNITAEDSDDFGELQSVLADRAENNPEIAEIVRNEIFADSPGRQQTTDAPADAGGTTAQVENAAPQGMQDIYVETPQAANFLNQRIKLNEYANNPAAQQTAYFDPINQQSFDELAQTYNQFMGNQDGIDYVESPATTQGQAFADADPENIEQIMADADVAASMGDQMAEAAYTPPQAPPPADTSFGDRMAAGAIQPEDPAAGRVLVNPDAASGNALLPEAAAPTPVEAPMDFGDLFDDPPDAPPPLPGYPTQSGEMPIGSIAESRGADAAQGYPTQSGEIPFRLQNREMPEVGYRTQALDPVPESDPVRGIRDMLTSPNPEQLKKDMANKTFFRPGVMSRNTPEAFREVTGPITRTLEVGVEPPYR